jgi:hypothetical protein
LEEEDFNALITGSMFLEQQQFVGVQVKKCKCRPPRAAIMLKSYSPVDRVRVDAASLSGLVSGKEVRLWKEEEDDDEEDENKSRSCRNKRVTPETK